MSGSQPVRIAIIDDDESLCRSMSRLLKAANYETASYDSAEGFLSSPVRHAFHCILLDIQLEGMSGLELHDKLLSEGDLTPVIFITAHDAPEVRAQAEEAGCVGYFRKSDPGREVLSAIRRAVA